MRRGREEKKPLSFPDLSSKLPIYAQNITNTAELFEPGINLENPPLLWVPRDLAYLYLPKEPCHWKQSRDYFKWMNNELAQLSNGSQTPGPAQGLLWAGPQAGFPLVEEAPPGWDQEPPWSRQSQGGPPTVTGVTEWRQLRKMERYFILQTVSLG